MREPGKTPQFDRLIRDVERAKLEWNAGNYDKSERILRVVGSVAMEEASERKPGTPVPE